jgi:hypothetical protein
MAIYKNTPPIVTSGLVLNLDAANIKSYPGSGTTWTDLSGNRLNGTLNNNTYNTLGGGNISFNGSNSVVGLGDNDLFSFTSGGGVDLPFSVSCWVRLTAYGTGIYAFSTLIAKSQSISGAWSREWAFSQANSTGFVFNIFNPDTTGVNYIGRLVGSPLSLNIWYHLTATYSGSKTASGINLYINGILQSAATNVGGGTYTGMGNTATTVELGRQYSSGVGDDSGYFSGNISNVLIYRNKALSASEIQQNYNALKSRFNLI